MWIKIQIKIIRVKKIITNMTNGSNNMGRSTIVIMDNKAEIEKKMNQQTFDKANKMIWVHKYKNKISTSIKESDFQNRKQKGQF